MMDFSIQQIFKDYGPQYIKKHKLSKEQWKVYNSILKCKTRSIRYTYYYLCRMW